MKVKKWLFMAILIMSASKAWAVWDVTLPLGSEAKSLGDDRLRELKVDIQTSLRYEGDFPGSDTSNPRFIWTPSSGTTALRPTGNALATGMLYINISSGCIEQYNGTTWGCVAVVASSAVTSSGISVEVAGPGLSGGGGIPLQVNVDTNSFTITNDTVTIKTGGVTSAHIFDGTIDEADLSSDLILPGEVTAPSQPGFMAYNSASDSNVTGNNETLTVDFDTELFDTGSDFAGDTFTAPKTGFYLLTTGVTFRDAASGNKCELKINTNNKTFTQERWALTGETMSVTVYAAMSSGHTASVSFNCSGGATNIDVLGEGSTTTTTGVPTFFSGVLIN